MKWVRLWNDMPTDPKWRVVAKRSGRPLTEVLSVFAVMLTNAGANATERGTLDSWSDEDVAAALDMEPAHVTAIREAMQGKTLDGDKLTGWEKRQPNREDGSAERARAWRERNRTQPNAEKRPDTDPEKIREESTSLPSEQEAAREEVKAKNFDLEGVGLGLGGEPSVEARREVARLLNIGDPSPVLEAYRRWPPSRRARAPDAHFRRAAPTIFARLTEAERAACVPLAEPEPEIKPKLVRASPQLAALLAKGGRPYAH